MATDATDGPESDWDRNAVLAVVLAGMVLLSVGAVTVPAAAQSDTVTLTVSVVDRSSDPVGGATVTAEWDGGNVSRTTANNGKAFIDVPSGQEVTLTVDHPEYVRNFPLNVTRTSDSDVRLNVGERAELTLVAETTEGERIGGATVTLARNGRVVDQGRTDENGQYVSETVEAGRYTARVTKPRYYNQSVTVTPGSTSTRQVTLERGTVEYEFRIVDDHFDSPRPVANATVQVGNIATLTTFEEGRTRIGIPVNTVQRVEVSKSGYRTVTERVRVGESGEEVTLRIRRTPTLTVRPNADRVVIGERVTVRVRNAYDEPVAGATILRDGSAVGETSENGTATVLIESEQSEIRAEADGVTSDPVSVEGVEAADGTTSTPTPTTEDGSSGLAPGFGVGAVLLALSAFAVTLVRRRR